MDYTLGIVILAAGSSSRLGQPKQLLEYKGTTLLRNIVSESSKLSNTAIVVVTGANKDAVEAEPLNTDLTFCYNQNWADGMGSSISIGLKQILKHHPGLSSCIITVCDQPFVTSALLNDLIKEQNETGKGIVASTYAETVGTPVLFTSKYFETLKSLCGHEGAKKIVQIYIDDTVTIQFEKGAIDIDTIYDYNNLINSQ
jgi:molybdenum cofactor cytidylyltransferase